MNNNRSAVKPNNQPNERNANMEIKINEKKQNADNEKRESWMDKMREAANSGFIPYAQYMKSFVPEVKYDNWSAWRRLLEYEGYVVKDGDFGWIVVEKPKPQIVKSVEPKPDDLNFHLTRSLIETITSEVVKRLQEANK